MKTAWKGIFTLLLAGMALDTIRAQCTSEMTTGHFVITSNKGCAPFYMEIKNLYSNATADAVFTVDWGDGTVETYIGSADPNDGGSSDPLYTPDFSHTYTQGSTECGHNIVIEATNACTLPEDARLELQVSIWDTDELGIDINPDQIRVCQGYAASVRFRDDSDWNCFPRPSRQNDPPRHIQWIYEGGSMQVPGFAGAPIAGPVIPVNNTGVQSDVINIPANDPANPGNPYPVGANFQVRLNNWNRCNSYPDNAPVNVASQIVVVESPNPDFVTKKENAANPVQNVFCVDDIVYFDNASTGPGGSNLQYEWEFFDGPNATDPLLSTKSNENPVLVYSTGGPKLVRLTVTDVNAVGGCSSIVERTIDVFPTTIAQINASQTNFCKDEGASDSYSVTFTDVSTGATANTKYKWEFYDESGNLYKTVPNSGFASSELGPFTETYTHPGKYKVVLITKDNLTSCFTRDEKFVNVYLNPEPEFTVGNACANEDVEFYDQSTITPVNGNNITQWEWDFDFDGSTFNADQTFNSSMPDTIPGNFQAGNRQVALRVTEDQYGCNKTIVKNVNVNPLPLAQFSKDKENGCSPLEVVLDNTGHASQPAPIATYNWQVLTDTGFVDQLIQDPAAAGFNGSASMIFANKENNPKYFQFRLQAVSQSGCKTTSKADSVEVFPSFKPGFNHLNYDPLAKNCAPVDVMFKVDQPTQDLNPTEYDWSVWYNGNVVHSETKPAGTMQFDYEFNASGNNVNEYKVKLGADVPGICMSDSTLTIKVNPIPVSDFKIDTLDFTCDSIKLEISARQKGLVSYDWKIEDDLSTFLVDTLQDTFLYGVEREPIGSGDKSLKFELKTNNFTFCESAAYRDSLIVPEQIDIGTDFTATPTELIYPNTLVFLNNNTNPGSWNYNWDFGDGTSSSAKDPGYHEFPTIGQYKVTLSAGTPFCTEIDSQQVEIKAPPLYVDFDYDPAVGCAPLTVEFTNQSINALPDSYEWDFGDGNSSVVQNPTYTFDEPGVYSVSLTATNAGGLTLTEDKQDIIVVVEPPEVDFTVDPKTQIFPNTTVNIENNSTVQTSTPAYLWGFGDGDYTIERSPGQHEYDKPGEYWLKLSITENACTSQDSTRVKIEDPMEAIVDFDFKPTSGCVPLTVEFVNRSIGAEEGTYIWEFGDGQGVSTEPNPTHTYYKPGIYTVRLRAQNISGVESEMVKDSIIQVYAYPGADFSVTPTFQEFPDATVEFENNSIADGREYFWKFGDGNESAETVPGPHIYGEPGTYKIRFAVEENGCRSIDSARVHIKPTPPVVDFDYEPESGCAPLQVHFYNTSKYADPSTYQWDFGDGYGTSNKENPVYTYYEPGIYTVTLSATNKSGVVVTEEKNRIIEVFEVPVASFYARPEKVHVPEEAIHMTNRSYGADTYLWNFGDGNRSEEFEPTHSYQEAGLYTISLIATSNLGCSDTLLVEDAVEAILEEKVKVPNAFTPSLDGPSEGYVGMSGTNDVFYPVVQGVAQMKMQVFNRWGELIYETNNKNYGWNGYHNGKICPQDVYIYKIDVKYLDGKEELLFGDVTLIR